jgi:hypothetical protein
MTKVVVAVASVVVVVVAVAVAGPVVGPEGVVAVVARLGCVASSSPVVPVHAASVAASTA